MVTLCIDATSGKLNVSACDIDTTNINKWLITDSFNYKVESNTVVETIDTAVCIALAGLNKKIVDVNKIYFTLGPGSYTSLRAVFSFVKGYSIQNTVEVIGVSLFLLAALRRVQAASDISNDTNKVSIKGNAQEAFSVIFTGEHFYSPKAKILTAGEVLIENLETLDSSNIVLYDDLDVLELMKEFFLGQNRYDEQTFTKLGHIYRQNLENLETKSPLMYVKGVNALTLKERNK